MSKSNSIMARAATGEFHRRKDTTTNNTHIVTPTRLPFDAASETRTQFAGAQLHSHAALGGGATSSSSPLERPKKQLPINIPIGPATKAPPLPFHLAGLGRSVAGITDTSSWVTDRQAAIDGRSAPTAVLIEKKQKQWENERGPDSGMKSASWVPTTKAALSAGGTDASREACSVVLRERAARKAALDAAAKAKTCPYL